MAKAPVKRTAKPKKPRETEAPEGEMPAQPPETATATVETPEAPLAREESPQPATAREEELARESAAKGKGDGDAERAGRDREDRPPRRDGKPGGNGGPAATLNIAKLQAMSMTELNHMAKDMGIENFGTMRKHEVIFHILQKNAERSGVLFSEGVLEVLQEGFGFLRSQSFNYLPCPEDIYVSPS